MAHKQESVAHKQKKKKIESVPEEVQKLYLLVDKDFKSPIVNIFKELRKSCLKN